MPPGERDGLLAHTLTLRTMRSVRLTWLAVISRGRPGQEQLRHRPVRYRPDRGVTGHGHSGGPAPSRD
jgi:hypothetical protein